MNENKIQAFRMLMAEEGTEMTPKQAKRAYKASKSIVRRSRMMSMIDIWSLEDLDMEGFSRDERMDLVDLYKTAKEL